MEVFLKNQGSVNEYAKESLPEYNNIYVLILY